MFGQIAGVLCLNVLAALLMGLFLWGVDAAILWLGIRTFRRSEITARM